MSDEIEAEVHIIRPHQETIKIPVSKIEKYAEVWVTLDMERELSLMVLSGWDRGSDGAS